MNADAFRINNYSLTHTGRVRTLNEDRYFADPDAGVWAVADGMGGHNAGDVASEAIVQELAHLPPPSSAPMLSEIFAERVGRANGKIRQVSRERGNIIIGSTIVGLLVYGSAYRCVWSGDSRAYLLRGHTLVQLSRDHTEVQELLDRGLLTPEEAETYPRKNVITHAIGVADQIYLESKDGEILAGDTFLLCSDGLTTHVSPHEIGDAMAGRRVREICDTLIDLTLERGATDNVTVCAVQFFTSRATVPADLMDEQFGADER